MQGLDSSSLEVVRSDIVFSNLLESNGNTSSMVLMDRDNKHQAGCGAGDPIATGPFPQTEHDFLTRSVCVHQRHSVRSADRFVQQY